MMFAPRALKSDRVRDTNDFAEVADQVAKVAGGPKQ